MKVKNLACVVLLILGAAACQNDEIQTSEDLKSFSPMEAYIGDTGLKSATSQLAITPEYLDEINEGLATAGQTYRVIMAEYYTAAGSGEIGQLVLAKHVGNKQLSFDFVPNDARRSWSGPSQNEITYAIDQTGDAVPLWGGLSKEETTNAIVRGTNTWDDLTCSDLGLSFIPTSPGEDIGVAGGSPFIFADIQHAGFGFDLGPGVLGVTFTFGFIEGGEWTDIDDNGKFDVAFREIYYSSSWVWVDGEDSGIDVESVALHEIGHGLSQAHFGRIVINEKKLTLKASPRAVMNALYLEPFRELKGSDIGGHCSIWAEWPHN